MKPPAVLARFHHFILQILFPPLKENSWISLPVFSVNELRPAQFIQQIMMVEPVDMYCVASGRVSRWGKGGWTSIESVGEEPVGNLSLMVFQSSPDWSNSTITRNYFP